MLIKIKIKNQKVCCEIYLDFEQFLHHKTNKTKTPENNYFNHSKLQNILAAQM